jgi:hypothetical protein
MSTTRPTNHCSRSVLLCAASQLCAQL